jgi:hypothetical protein
MRIVASYPAPAGGAWGEPEISRMNVFQPQ